MISDNGLEKRGPIPEKNHSKMISRKLRVPAISWFCVHELTIMPKEQHNINIRKFAR